MIVSWRAPSLGKMKVFPSSSEHEGLKIVQLFYKKMIIKKKKEKKCCYVEAYKKKKKQKYNKYVIGVSHAFSQPHFKAIAVMGSSPPFEMMV